MVTKEWERLQVDMVTLLPTNTSKSLPGKNTYHQMNHSGIGSYHFLSHLQQPGTDTNCYYFYIYVMS